METTILGSRYELLERVGMGGMAIVYKAKDKMLNRFVAIKILREEFKENEDFIRRFKIESQAAASLSHQNIAQIYDVGEENGMNYIVMEFLEGETLKKHILSNDGALSRKEAMNYSMQICRALEHAHSKYVVHRDIKPQNIVLTESGKLKLADFGIARAANNTTTVNSKNNMAVGSAHYLSPEQARGGYTDHRSDIYSLGVVMYEMFCGKLPFDAEESVSVVMQHLHEEPARPCEVNPDLPAGIEAIILKAMKKEQRLRYENATQILEDLVLVYQNPNIPVSALNAALNEDAPVQPVKKEPQKRTQRSTTTGQKRKKKKKSISGAAIALILLIVALLTAGGFWIHGILFPDMGEEVEIPNLVGLMYEDAVEKAKEASTDHVKFNVRKGRDEFNDAPKGTVIRQNPQSGKVKKTREITVDISKGPVVLVLEDYSGQTFDEVKQKLEKLGIKVVEEPIANNELPVGTIINQNPKETTKLAAGETVTLYVAVEQTLVDLKSVVGMDKEDAIEYLEKNHFKVIPIDAESDSAIGEVFEQDLKPGKVPMGSTVTIYISSGPGAEDPEDIDEPEPEPEPEPTPEPEPAPEPEPEPKPEPKPVKQTVSVSLNGLNQNGSTRVKIVGNGVTVFEKDITSSSGSASVSFEGEKGVTYDVYCDGTWRREVKN